MTQFALFATLLTLVVAALIVPPLWFGHRKQQEADRKAANLAIFRDQLGELEHERNEGSLADTDFEQARNELQRRLLEDVEDDGDTRSADPTSSRRTAIVVLLLLPLLGLMGYGLLGDPRALDPAATAPQKQMTQGDIEGMVAKLAERMKANPDDPQGWLMLGRSYKMLGRHADAAEAYSHAEPVINKDPDLLAAYAETLAMAGGKGLAGKPRQLIDKALKLDPKHGHSLFLAGAAAIEAGDRKQAIAHWEALLPQVEPGSELDQMLRDGLQKLRTAN